MRFYKVIPCLEEIKGLLMHFHGFTVYKVQEDEDNLLNLLLHQLLNIIRRLLRS